jgi:hypothetical protein
VGKVVARPVGVGFSGGTGVDATDGVGDGLGDAGDRVGVSTVGVGVADSALFGVTLNSASFW